MATTVTLRGVVGVIRWAYYEAARLEGYIVTQSPTACRLSGRIVLQNAYNLSRRPLRFVAPTKVGEWAWPILEFTIADERISATLGPPDGRTT